MEARQIALKLFLDALGVPATIETVNDRKRVQKAVYLGQLSGVDLAYRFGWYLKGPYSPFLTRDYFNLEESLALGDRDWQDRELENSVARRLKKIVPLMKPAPDVSLSQADWLELISSLHFLREVRGLDSKKSLAVIKNEKPRLSKFYNKAEKALREVSLIS